jgi:hypothetical protein
MKMSNSKQDCRVWDLQFFVKQISTMAFWQRAHSGQCFIQLFIIIYHQFHFYKANRGSQFLRILWTLENDHLQICLLRLKHSIQRNSRSKIVVSSHATQKHQMSNRGVLPMKRKSINNLRQATPTTTYLYSLPTAKIHIHTKSQKRSK